MYPEPRGAQAAAHGWVGDVIDETNIVAIVVFVLLKRTAAGPAARRLRGRGRVDFRALQIAQ